MYGEVEFRDRITPVQDVHEIVLKALAREQISVITEVDYMGNRTIRIKTDCGNGYKLSQI